MIRLSLAEVSSAIGGRISGDENVLVTGSAETDSRLVGPGSLFFAKPGEVTDGHRFVGAAAHAGAVAAVVEHLVESVEIPQIVVADVVEALGLLATEVLRRVRAERNLRVVGITGSNGKTTTKNMLREILSGVGPTVAPIESYNNEVGAPISMLKVDESTEYLVVELGAGGIGSIGYLAKMCKPDVAVELKVGLAHAGEWGGIETTAKIKGELIENMSDSGVAILNADDGYVREMAKRAPGQTVFFGTSADADYQAAGIDISLAGTAFDLTVGDGAPRRVTLKILGEHHVYNALASIAAAEALGVSREHAIDAIEAMPLAERWRMQLFERADGVAIINDAYNASPDSTKAALQTLALLGRREGRRTIAVLGEMAELGEFSAEQHDAIGRIVVRLNIDQLIVVGAGAKLVHMGASQEGSWDGESKYFDAIEPALEHLREMLTSGDIVLVKSSKSANLRHLGDALAGVEA